MKIVAVIILFLGIFSHEDISKLNTSDKKDIYRTYNNLKKCKVCREGYGYFLEVISSNESAKDTGFTPGNFKRLKENEGKLEILAKCRSEDFNK